MPQAKLLCCKNTGTLSLNLRSLTGINDLIGQNFRSFVNDISSRRLNLLLQILDLLFEQVAFGISKYAVNNRTDLGTLFTRSFVFLTVVIGGLVNIEALLFFVQVDLEAFRDKVEDFLADSYLPTNNLWTYMLYFKEANCLCQLFNELRVLC